MNILPTYETDCTGDCQQGRNCTCATTREDSLNAARGIVNAVLLAIPVWALIALAIWAAV